MRLRAPVESQVDTDMERNERWARAKERFLAEGGTDELAWDAERYFAGEPYVSLQSAATRVAIEIGTLIARREVSGA